MPDEDERIESAQNQEGLRRKRPWPPQPTALTLGKSVPWDGVKTTAGVLRRRRGWVVSPPGPMAPELSIIAHQVDDATLQAFHRSQELSRILKAPLRLGQGLGISAGPFILKGLGGTPPENLMLEHFLFGYEMGKLVGIFLHEPRPKLYQSDRLYRGTYVLPVLVTGVSLTLEAFLALDPTLPPNSFETIDTVTVLIAVMEPVVDAFVEEARENRLADRAWGQADGAIPNGTRVVKIWADPPDRQRIGAIGTVLSSIGPFPEGDKVVGEYGYRVAWDGDKPHGRAVFTRGRHIWAAAMGQ